MAMKLSPFYDVVRHAEVKMNAGWTVYQQWNCWHCGAKQTMPDADTFYKFGRCEECQQITNIEQHGCNFMATKSIPVGLIDDALKP
jgi:hypothetical protein